MRITQPVLLRSFKDEFNVEVPENCPTTPAAPGSVLRGTSEENTQWDIPNSIDIGQEWANYFT